MDLEANQLIRRGFPHHCVHSFQSLLQQLLDSQLFGCVYGCDHGTSALHFGLRRSLVNSPTSTKGTTLASCALVRHIVGDRLTKITKGVMGESTR